MRLIRKLIALFHPTMQERVDEAIEKVAKLQGKIAEHRHQAKTYSQLLHNVDHEQDWWSYATLKQKVQDNNTAVAALQIDLSNAVAAYHAVRIELDSEKDNEHALSSLPADRRVTPADIYRAANAVGGCVVHDAERGGYRVVGGADGRAFGAVEPTVHDIP